MSIRIENVTKNFNGKTAVDNITLDIPQGEFFAFLGPNGAGKTTTVKMMAGLLRPTSGTITVAGYDMSKDLIEVKSMLAYVPDQPYMYDKLTGREFLNFVGTLYNMPEKDLSMQTDKYMELFDMHDYIDELTENYSHGMKQRLILSATFLHRPKVVLVDEPIVGLDPQSARLVKNMFKEQAGSGVTVFMSTHVLSVAEETADRIGIINNGKIVALGNMDELRRRTQTDGNLEELFFHIMSQQNCA
ncbi:MAG: ABC transporter ATP-binding protein [Planctomycetes bacterium]|nr:ABC transporter ATP-binding protein [Planctomycetota bacterium]